MTTLQALALKACPATSHGEESWRSGTRCVCEAIVGVLREAYEMGSDHAVEQIADGLRARGAGRVGNCIVIPPEKANTPEEPEA